MRWYVCSVERTKAGSCNGSMVKESACQGRRCGFHPWVGKIPWRRAWQPTPVFWPGKSHGQRSLEGYNSWGCKESDTTWQLNNKSKGSQLYIIIFHLANGWRHTAYTGPSNVQPALHIRGCRTRWYQRPTMPFYTRNFSIWGFLYPWGSWKQGPCIWRDNCNLYSLTVNTVPSLVRQANGQASSCLSSSKEKSSLVVRPIPFHKYLGLSVTCRSWTKSWRHHSHRTHVLLLLKKSWPHQLCSSLEFSFLLRWTPSWLLSHPSGRHVAPSSSLAPTVQSILISCAQSVLLSRASAWPASRRRLLLFIWQWFVFLSYFSTPTTNQARAGYVFWSDSAHSHNPFSRCAINIDSVIQMSTLRHPYLVAL